MQQICMAESLCLVGKHLPALSCLLRMKDLLYLLLQVSSCASPLKACPPASLGLRPRAQATAQHAPPSPCLPPDSRHCSRSRSRSSQRSTLLSPALPLLVALGSCLVCLCSLLLCCLEVTLCQLSTPLCLHRLQESKQWGWPHSGRARVGMNSMHSPVCLALQRRRSARPLSLKYPCSHLLKGPYHWACLGPHHPTHPLTHTSCVQVSKLLVSKWQPTLSRSCGANELRDRVPKPLCLYLLERLLLPAPHQVCSLALLIRLLIQLLDGGAAVPAGCTTGES